MKQLKKLNKQTVLNIAKGAAMLVGAISTGTLIGLAIKNIVPIDELNRYNKVMVIAGAVLMGGIAGDAGAEYAGNLFDALVTVPLTTVEEAVKAMKELE